MSSVFQNVRVMSDEKAREFKAAATPFEYNDESGVVKGWRNSSGEVLIESCQVADEPPAQPGQ